MEGRHQSRLSRSFWLNKKPAVGSGGELRQPASPCLALGFSAHFSALSYSDGFGVQPSAPTAQPND